MAGTGFRTTVEANTLALALERPKQSSESSHGAEEDVRDEVPSGGWTEGPRCEDEEGSNHAPRTTS